MQNFDSEWFLGRLAGVRRSQAELSRFLSVDKATVHNLLRGKRRLQLSEVEPVARFLDSTSFDVLQHAGIEFDSFPTIPATLDDERHAVIFEIDARKLTKDGIDESSGQVAEGCRKLVPWGFPAAYANTELGIEAKTGVIMEVQGDSMEPTLRSGDRVLIDIADRRPSPPGLFALWDGVSVVVKRVEHIVGSSPQMLSIKSDNLLHDTASLPVEEVTILGRVAWSARKV